MHEGSIPSSSTHVPDKRLTGRLSTVSPKWGQGANMDLTANKYVFTRCNIVITDKTTSMFRPSMRLAA